MPAGPLGGMQPNSLGPAIKSLLAGRLLLLIDTGRVPCMLNARMTCYNTLIVFCVFRVIVSEHIRQTAKPSSENPNPTVTGGQRADGP